MTHMHALTQHASAPIRTTPRLRLLVLALSTTLAFTGCANMSDQQRSAATGAAIGTAAGALLGRATAGGDRAGSTRTGAVIGGIAGAAGGYIWSQRMAKQKADMERATQGTGVGVTQTPDNQLKLDIPSDISFAVNRADVESNFRPILDRFAASLKEHPDTEIRIVGHTDNTGSDAINNPLSQRRADSTRDYLVDRGVAPRRIQTAGRGEREPIADNSTDAGRAKNRRVEIYIAEPAQAAAAPAR